MVFGLRQMLLCYNKAMKRVYIFKEQHAFVNQANKLNG